MLSVIHTSKRYDPDAVYIGRPSIWGNPFKVLDHGRPGAILKFTIWWYAPEQKKLRERALKEFPLNAKLACWCVPDPCHGDIISGYVNWKRNG